VLAQTDTFNGLHSVHVPGVLNWLQRKKYSGYRQCWQMSHKNLKNH